MLAMNYLFFAFLAATCFAVSQLLNKLLSKHSIENKDSLMAFFMITTCSFAVFLLPFVPWTLPSFEVIKLLLITTSTFLLGYYCFFTGIFDTDASTTAPLFQLQAVLVGLLAFLFLGEKFPAQNYVWLALLLLGAGFVSYTQGMTWKSFLRKGVLFVLAMQVFHAVSNLFIGILLKQISPIQILFYEDILIGVLCIPYLLWRKPKLNYSVKQIAPMFLSTYVVGIGVISLFTAFKVNLTVSSVIGLLSAPMVFVISVLASRFSPQLLEHHSAKVYTIRAIGLGIIFLAALKVALG
jgi:drug/metabolite transporter (DMT)-like permease